MNANPRPHHLPRLNPEFYRGDAAVHWTLTIFDRQTGWLTESLHLKFRELMLHAAARENLLCPSYCLMPDHDALSPSPRQSGERAGVRGFEFFL